MTDLVTGATGFIGSHLAQRLMREGRQVRVLCREGSEHKLQPDLRAKAEIVIGDLHERASLRIATAGIERVFHCGGHVVDWGTQNEAMETNVRGTKWLLEGAKAACATRFVHFSSISVFGTPLPPWFDDDSPYGQSRDPYSRTKIESEKLALGVGEGLAVTVMRPAIVYGPRGRWLEEPLAMIKSGRLLLIGGGTGTCHPCYIENLLDATLLAADDPRAIGQAFIVGDDDPISFRRYFAGIAEIAGRPPVERSIPVAVARAAAWTMELAARAVRSPERPMLTRTAVDTVTATSEMSMRKIRTVLGFRPRYDFASAIRELRARYTPTQPESAVSLAPPPP